MVSLEELRKPKIFEMAAFDWVATFVGLIIIMIILSIDLTAGNILVGMLGMTVIAIGTHILTGTPTKLNYKLGLSKKP